jgi:hypothetical protein
MAAPELPSLDVLATIPDPAADTAARTMPAPVVPPLPSLTRAERRRRAILYAVLSLSWIGGVIWYAEPREDMGNAGAIAGIPILFVISVLIVSAGVPAAPFSLRWHGGGACMTISSLMGVGPLLFASLALQGSFLSAPIVRGAAVGILCGLFGAIGMHAVCPCAVRSHLLLGHGAPILLLALLGGALGALRGRA